MRSGSPRTSRTVTSPRARSAPPSESGRPPAHQERALALDPAHSGALNELGRISLHRGGHPRAASHFIQAARSAPGVSTYGRNAELSVQRVLGLTTRSVYLASCGLMLAVGIPVSRWPAVLGYA